MISHLDTLILPGLIVALVNTHPWTPLRLLRYRGNILLCVAHSLHAPAATGKSYNTAEVSNTVIVKTLY
jgi:hypothetical protein